MEEAEKETSQHKAQITKCEDIISIGHMILAKNIADTGPNVGSWVEHGSNVYLSALCLAASDHPLYTLGATAKHGTLPQHAPTHEPPYSVGI